MTTEIVVKAVNATFGEMRRGVFNAGNILILGFIIGICVVVVFIIGNVIYQKVKSGRQQNQSFA